LSIMQRLSKKTIYGWTLVRKGNPLAVVRHCSDMNGKVAKRAGKSEDLSEHKA
jgi:hypothetical protein